jgi:hypothetical protein
MKTLKNTIRKSLIEAKEEKTNRIIEVKLASTRAKAILESTSDFAKFKDLPFERQWEIGLPLMQELAIIKSHNPSNQLLTEGGILDLLASIFGTGFSAGFETIFENMLSSLLAKMGLTGFLADAIVFFFSRNPGKIIDSFRDCKALAGNLGQAIMEAYIHKLAKEYNMAGNGMNFIRNAMIETLENSDFGKNLAGQFQNFICGFFDTVKSKGKDVVNAINPQSPAPATGS